MLRATAKINLNAVVWIMSLDNNDERQSTEQVLTFLEPFLQAKQIPFVKVEPKTAAELYEFLTLIEHRAKAGLRPIIHFDTHGGQTDGLYIAASREFVPWRELVQRLRPVNVATQNNVCIVSAACFSLHTIMELDITAATPFFVMFAPQHTVTFGFIEERMFGFYEDVFTSQDMMLAHERHLAPNLEGYHCQRLLLKSLIGYIRDSCTGRGRRKRVRSLVRKSLGPGKKHPDTPELRRVARRVARAVIRPNQALIDRYARPFLMGQKLSIGISEILPFARADALKRNVLLRHAARSKRRNRRVHHAKRRLLRELKRC
jgi:hypothetical protein